MFDYKNKYFWFFVLTVLGYGLFEYYRPRPIDWSTSYMNKDKIPFGTKVTFELMQDLFKGQKIESLRLPIYNHLIESKLPTQSNYVFICQSFEVDKNDRRAFLKYIGSGNTAFVSAYGMPDSLTKHFGFKAELKDPTLRDTAMVVNFVNPRFRSANGYVFKHDDGRNFFEVTDPKKVVVLAENTRNEPIFIKTTYGKGTVYWHNLPLAMTNYYLLDPQMGDFALKSLSYLPEKPVFWDEYQKQGRFGEDEQSVLRYIMQAPALKWAYYLVIFGLLLYMIFVGKRTQRIIPIMESPKNVSLEFTESIGRLYYQQADHANIAQKKVQHFLAHLRTRYGLRTNEIDEDFKQTLSDKSGIDKADVEVLFKTIKQAVENPYLPDFELVNLNQKMEDFRQNAR